MSVSRFGPPPTWFFDVYDAIQMGVPVHHGRSIRQVPLYVRYRHRLVNEAIRSARYQQVKESRAQPVVDVGNL